MIQLPDEASRSTGYVRACQPSKALVIGLVNNMSDVAFQATTDLFETLLQQAMPDGFDLKLRLFCPPARSNVAQTNAALPGGAETSEDLWSASLDGLIVTGAEPRATRIADEPCLPFVSNIVDWANGCALPTIWSCLAAHAAVYRLDGIERRQRGSKLFGVFECDSVAHHPLLDGDRATWTIPHSRLNELPEVELARSGYQILTRSLDVGVDTFVKEAGASHTFLNGHPEYGQTTLRNEYRRDVRRFLLGEQAHYPLLPTNYFHHNVVPKLMAFREMALNRRAADLMTDFPTITATAMPWRDTAIGLFRNWLLDVARRTLVDTLTFDVSVKAEPALRAPLLGSPFPGQAGEHGNPEPMQIGRQSL